MTDKTKKWDYQRYLFKDSWDTLNSFGPRDPKTQLKIDLTKGKKKKITLPTVSIQNKE